SECEAGDQSGSGRTFADPGREECDAHRAGAIVVTGGAGACAGSGGAGTGVEAVVVQRGSIDVGVGAAFSEGASTGDAAEYLWFVGSGGGCAPARGRGGRGRRRAA